MLPILATSRKLRLEKMTKAEKDESHIKDRIRKQKKAAKKLEGISQLD